MTEVWSKDYRGMKQLLKRYEENTKEVVVQKRDFYHFRFCFIPLLSSFYTSLVFVLYLFSFCLIPLVEAVPANRLVISEVRPGTGLTDEFDFVELYNASAVSVALADKRLMYRGSGFDLTLVAWPAGSIAVMPPKTYYLLSRTPTAFSVARNEAFSENLESVGSLAIVNAINNTVIDAVAWGTLVTNYREGSPAPLPGTNSSIERRATNFSDQTRMAFGGSDETKGNGEDTDDNSVDFLLRLSPQPQRSETAEDVLPPAIITLYAATAKGPLGGRVQLSWTAPGEDGNLGTAKSYVVKFSTTPIIDSASYASASTFLHALVPLPAGSPEKLIVDAGLSFGTRYYFSVTAVDNAGLKSDFSQNPVNFRSVSAFASLPDNTPPGRIADLTVSPGPVEGQIRLSWTAPGDDGLFGTAEQYFVRYAATLFTAENFSLATEYVQSWAPFQGGIPEVQTLSGFTAGATYYFAVVAKDDANLVGLVSNIVSGTAQVDVTPPGRIGSVAYELDLRREELVLSFLATGDDGALGTASGYDIRYSSMIFTTATASSKSAFQQTFSAKASGQAEVLRVPLALFPIGTTSYVAIAVKDERGNRGAYSDVLAFVRMADLTTPLPPAGPKGRTPTGGGWEMSWDTVKFNEDGTALKDLLAYRVYRKAGTAASFVRVAEVSKLTLTWVDTDPPRSQGAGVYYYVTAVDENDHESAPSFVVSLFGNDGLIRTSDDAVTIALDVGLAEELNKAGNELREDIQLRIVKKTTLSVDRAVGEYEIKATKVSNGGDLPKFAFTRRAKFVFRLPEASASPSQRGSITGARAAVTAGRGETYSVFWWDGINWIKLGGTVDAAAGTIQVSAAKAGTYQVRVTALATEFAVTTTSPGKVFTPNGDGVNDQVSVFFENPKDSAIGFAKIYDIRGAEVADMKLGSTSNSYVWDGKDRRGGIAPRGMYLYVIQVEGKSFSGSLVIAK